jgi:hypothetical protein
VYFVENPTATEALRNPLGHQLKVVSALALDGDALDRKRDPEPESLGSIERDEHRVLAVAGGDFGSGRDSAEIVGQGERGRGSVEVGELGTRVARGPFELHGTEGPLGRPVGQQELHRLQAVPHDGKVDDCLSIDHRSTPGTREIDRSDYVGLEPSGHLRDGVPHERAGRAVARRSISCHRAEYFLGRGDMHCGGGLCRE